MFDSVKMCIVILTIYYRLRQYVIGSTSNNRSGLATERVSMLDPRTKRWVIVVGRNASCASLSSTFSDWTVLMVDGGTAASRYTTTAFPVLQIFPLLNHS